MLSILFFTSYLALASIPEQPAVYSLNSWETRRLLKRREDVQKRRLAAIAIMNERIADDIEYYRDLGYSLEEAIAFVQEDLVYKYGPRERPGWEEAPFNIRNVVTNVKNLPVSIPAYRPLWQLSLFRKSNSLGPD